MIFSYVRFAFAAFFFLAGILTVVISTFGAYRFDYCLNRMHSAAIGDTLGLMFTLIGLMILEGFNFASLKLLLVIAFLWMASPVSSHLICKLEVTTDSHLNEHLGKKDD